MARDPHLPLYRILSRLGRGSFADVFLAENVIKGDLCAVKIFRKLESGSGTPINHTRHIQYRTELQVLSRVTHPNLVRLHDAGRSPESGEPFLVLDVVKGEDFVTASRDVSRAHFLELIAQLCRVLDHLHRKNIFHGDLKPHNVLVVKDSNAPSSTPVIKLIDLGSASVGTRATGHPTQGSPFYMAPEVIQGYPHSSSSDLYAIGAILFECLEGIPPHRGRSTGEVLQAQLRESKLVLQDRALVELHPLILQLLEKNPAKRPSSALELINQLNRIAGTHRRFTLHTADTLASSLENLPLVEREEAIERMHHHVEQLVQELNPLSIRSVVLRAPIGFGKTRLLEEIILAARLRGVDTISIRDSSSKEVMKTLELISSSRNSFELSPPAVIAVDEPTISASALRAMAHQASCRNPRPLLIISTHDSCSPSEKAIGCDAFEIENLKPITTKGIYYTLGKLFAPEQIIYESCMRLQELSGGNPRLTWDLVKHSLDRSDLGNLHPLPLDFYHSSAVPLPKSIQATVEHLMETILPTHLTMMSFLAASDTPLSVADLAHLTSQSLDSTLSQCITMNDVGLLRKVTFKNTSRFEIQGRLVREKLLAHLDVDAQRQLHDTLGRWHMQKPGRREAAALAAPHFVAAGLRDKAFHAYIAAADVASMAHDDLQAVDMCERALQLCPSETSSYVELVLRLSQSLSRVGRATEAWTLLGQPRLASDLPIPIRIKVLTRKALCAGRQGRFSVMRNTSYDALQLAHDHALKKESIDPLRLFGSALCWLEQWEKGKRALFRAAYLARRYQLREVAAETLLTVALAQWRAGEYRLALNYERRRFRLLPHSCQPWPRATARSNIGILLADLGQYRSARSHHRESLQLSRRFSLLPHLAATHVNIGETHRSQGSWARALREYDKALDVIGDAGLEHTSPVAHANASHVLVRTGYIQESIDRLRHNLSRFSASGVRQVACMTLLGWGYVLHAAGRFRLAHKVAAHACEIAERVQLWNMMLECKTLMAIALTGWGRASLAKSLIQDAIRQFADRSPFDSQLAARIRLAEIEHRLGCSAEVTLTTLEPILELGRKRLMRWHVARVLMLGAQAHLASGRGDEAERDLLEVLESARGASDRSIAWRAAHLLGRVHEQALRYERALASYRESALTIHEIEMNLEDERYQLAFARQPEVIEARENYQIVQGRISPCFTVASRYRGRCSLR
jgi:serine/threonine protein kinase/tetratricopeptide (TPR) repeat protein